LRSEEERRATHCDYERQYRQWFSEQPPLIQQFLRRQGLDKPEPYDYSHPRSQGDDEDEFSDPADLAVDRTDPRESIVDFESVNSNELKDYCDHFGSALVWATKGKPDLYEMGARMLTILTVMRPELIGGMTFPLPKDVIANLRRALKGSCPKETGNFFRKPLAWIRKCSSLLQLGKRAYSATYGLRGDLIDAATCASIGGMDNKSRQAANKPIQEFSATFSGINSLPMRGNETRKRCKRAQLKNN
jgi:hypothetical protein